MRNHILLPDSKLLGFSNDAPWRCRAAADIHHETHDQVSQVEATVDKWVGERAQVAVRALGKSQDFVGAREHGLAVSQHRINPLELRQITRFALAHDFNCVSAPGIGDRCEARQAIAKEGLQKSRANVLGWC